MGCALEPFMLCVMVPLNLLTVGRGVQMLPAGEGRDSSAWQPQKIEYLAVNPEDIQAGNLESIIMGLSHATHALDVYTGLRHDKRSRLSSAPHIMHGHGTAEGSTTLHARNL